MKYKLTVLLAVAILAVACVANAATYLEVGGTRLIQVQNADGGWGWPLTGTSASNTIGPIGMGLAQAYEPTLDSNMYLGLLKVQTYLQNKIYFSPSDGYLAAKLDSIFGGTANVNHVMVNFYDKLAAGTYRRSATNTTNYTTASYIAAIRASRSGSQANMAAWDVAMGLVGAVAAGADTTDWVAGVQAEINELDSDNYYDVIGLAGAVYGLKAAGVDFDPTAGSHAAASNVADLASILASYQILKSGGFSWNAGYVIPDDGNEAIQETGYAMMALDAMGGYTAELASAARYLASVQLATGGWRNYNYTGTTSVENNEVTAEALWGMSLATDQLYLAVPADSLFVKQGETVSVALKQAVMSKPSAGFQAFLGFDNSLLTFASGSYTAEPYGWDILNISASGGNINLAAGIDGRIGQQPSTADAILANLSFTAGAAEGTTQVVFRQADHATTFTDDQGYEIPALVVNSPVITVDNTAPVISNMPANIEVGTDDGVCGAVVTWAAPTVTDNFDTAIDLVWSDVSGSYFDKGVTTVTLTATDDAGNSSTASFTVTVEDDEAPVIAGVPADIVVGNDEGDCGAVVTWTEPTATDNCDDTPAVVCSPASGTRFEKGTHTVTITATDDDGNSSTETFTVTVNDTEAPKLPAVADINVGTDDGVCSAVVSWNAIVATDNCDGTVTAVCNPASGSTFAKGETVVTVTATDAAGNSSSKTFKVTVVDDEAPVLPAISNISVGTDDGVCSAVVNWADIVATDNCDGSVVAVCDIVSGSTFAKGDTLVKVIATDAAGNSSSASFTVNVYDDEAPVLPVMSNISVGTDEGVCNAVVTWADIVATDNCDGTVTAVCSPASGSTFPKGDTVVTVTATDAAGKISTDTFTVTVVDNEAPVLPTIDDIEIGTDEGVCSAVVTWADIIATDNCDGTVTATCDIASGSTFEKGETVVTVTATDAAGNSSSKTFTVIVTDDEAPKLPAIANISVGTDAGVCNAVVNWADIVATDNCDGTVTAVCSPEAGSTFVKGSTVVTVTATDAAGNVSTDTFTVTVTDDEDPVLPAVSNITVGTDDGVCSAVVNWADIIATDNCDGTITAVCTPAAGSTFAKGETVVTVTATDAAGNDTSTTFKVTVLDDEAPVISGCPANITVNSLPNSSSAIVSWVDPTANDNCDGAVAVIMSAASGSSFNAGVTTVTCTATDAAGNTSTCSFNVTVRPYNVAEVSVALSGSFTTTFTRCVEFTFGGEGSTGAHHVISKPVTFVNGVGTVAFDSLPAGFAWTCVSAKDKLHSLRMTTGLSVSGDKYVASFSGQDALLCGDLTNDNNVDILDFGVFAGQFGRPVAVDTPCGYNARHADISGNGSVGVEDYTFISINFLRFGEQLCGYSTSTQSMPKISVTLDQLAAVAGYPAAVKADVDGNKIINTKDVKLFVDLYMKPGR